MSASASVSTSPGAEAGDRLHELIRLGDPAPTGSYLRDLWARREFAVVVPAADLRAQHLDTVLGNVWHLLNPIILVVVYYVIFGVLLRTSRGIDNFLTFLTIGVFTFQYVQRSMIGGAGTMVSNLGLIRSIQFPRAILVISHIVEKTLAFLPMLVIMLLLALVTGERPGARWLVVLPLYALLLLFNLGGAFILARLADRFRDVQNVLPHIFRVIFYASGIMFSVRRLVDNDTVVALFGMNPVYAFVTLVRASILDEAFQPALLLSAVTWTCVLLIGGFAYFKAGEQHYGRG